VEKLFQLIPRFKMIQFIKLRCDDRFTHAFTACVCVFKEITLVGSNQGNFFENATACSKRTLKTTVATQLKFEKFKIVIETFCFGQFFSPNDISGLTGSSDPVKFGFT